MKLLITGSNGFVAGSIIAQAQPEWEVHGIVRSGLPANHDNVHYHLLDLLDEEKLAALFIKIKPDAVIHTAAIANIDFCQQHTDMAEAINVGVTKTITQLCKEGSAKLVHCSTDTVFDGTKGFYTEDDLPNPVNFYAETKLQSEQIVLEAPGKNVVARLALVMGLPMMQKRNTSLSELVEKLKNNEPLQFAENEIRTPIDVITLGAALLELAGNTHFGGIIHLAGNTRINRFNMARQIAIEMNLSPGHIASVNSSILPGRAKRPDDASMDNTKARQLLKTPMLSLEEGLALIMKREM